MSKNKRINVNRSSNKLTSKNKNRSKSKNKNHTVRVLFITICLITTLIFLSIEIKCPKGVKAEENKLIYYKVQKGDTVGSIAEKYKPKGEKLNNIIVRIKVVNNVEDIIYPGQTIKIPLSKDWIKSWKKEIGI